VISHQYKYQPRHEVHQYNANDERACWRAIAQT